MAARKGGRVRFGILTQRYDPEPGLASLPGVLARGLGECGHDVRVAFQLSVGSLAPGYRIRWRADELWRAALRRLACYPSHDRSIARRMLNYTSLAGSALAWGTFWPRWVDAVRVNGSPITIGLPMWGVRYRFGVLVVLRVLDLGLDLGLDTVLSSSFVGRRGYHAVETALHAWCRRMYRCSDRVAYISLGVGPRLVDRGVLAAKLAYAPCGPMIWSCVPPQRRRARNWGFVERCGVAVRGDTRSHPGTGGTGRGLRWSGSSPVRLLARRLRCR